jgi:hypothetical protein
MILKRNFNPIRRSSRQWLNTSVEVFTAAAHVNGLGINLSDGGMCIFAIANLPVGSQIEVEFMPPRRDGRVRVPGTVRHRALYLYGIEFLSEYGQQSAAQGELSSCSTQSSSTQS